MKQCYEFRFAYIMSQRRLDLEPFVLKIYSVGHDMEPKDFWGKLFARGLNRHWILILSESDAQMTLIPMGVWCKTDLM